MTEQHQYIVINLKTFHISVECVERQLESLITKTVRDVELYYLSHKDEFERLREALSTYGICYLLFKS